MTIDADKKPNTVSDAMELFVDSRLALVHVGMWAVVTECDGRKCNAQPIVRGVFADGKAEQMPVITDIPIQWLMVSGYMIVCPVNKGDRVWLSFGDYSQEEFLNTGADDTTPNLPRRFNLADAVAHPGGRSYAEQFDYDNDKMIVGREDGLRIEIDDDSIAIGGKDGAGAQFKVTKTEKMSLTAGGIAGGELFQLVVDLMDMLLLPKNIILDVPFVPPALPYTGQLSPLVASMADAIKTKLNAMKA